MDSDDGQGLGMQETFFDQAIANQEDWQRLRTKESQYKISVGSIGIV